MKAILFSLLMVLFICGEFASADSIELKSDPNELIANLFSAVASDSQNTYYFFADKITSCQSLPNQQMMAFCNKAAPADSSFFFIRIFFILNKPFDFFQSPESISIENFLRLFPNFTLIEQKNSNTVILQKPMAWLVRQVTGIEKLTFTTHWSLTKNRDAGARETVYSNNYNEIFVDSLIINDFSFFSKDQTLVQSDQLFQIKNSARDDIPVNLGSVLRDQVLKQITLIQKQMMDNPSFDGNK